MGIRRVIVPLVGITVPTLLLCLGLAEVAFRTLVPASEVPYIMYDPQARLLRFDPQAKKEGTFTVGKAARHRSHWRVNDDGWISEIDYRPLRRSDRPLVAIIGDSFIEALQVDVDQSVSSVLRRRLAGEADVLSMGVSGAPLSQYLHLVRYAVQEYDPDAIVVNVVQNDLSESLRSVDSKKGTLQLEVEGDRVRELPILPYRPSARARLLRRSALVRYLWINAKIQTIGRRWRRAKPPVYAGNVVVSRVSKYRSQCEAATPYLMREMRQAAGDRILIVAMNAMRDDVYGTQTGDSLIAWIPPLVLCSAEDAGATTLDLDPVFRELFRDGARYTLTYDGHWSPAGHRAAAAAFETTLRSAGFPHPPVRSVRSTVDPPPDGGGH
ncbi:MAG: GDSL-type esterase/lipase family protein [Candidatus Eisenbacteria bacterium]|uniref:SGNH hydrolase-type esterase domain-containing protein n=1 Tax=Eiseniibacteriota bacterium TaxID=2212470 RepID=A0A956RPJ6_UNCEI|nr:hypothetical protein [Candidatus Eisenbacteria bacterium]